MRSRGLWLWALLGVAAVAAIAWAFPRAFPLLPQRLELSRSEARTIALAHLAELSPLPEDPLVIVRLTQDRLLEARLAERLQGGGRAAIEASPLPARLLGWEVIVYPPDAPIKGWTHRAALGLDGRSRSFEVQGQAAEAAPTILAPPAAVAETFLAMLGLDRRRLAGPEERTRTEQGHRELSLRYREEPWLGLPAASSGIDFDFRDDRFVGFDVWYEDAEAERLRSGQRTMALSSSVKYLAVLVCLLVSAWFFVRRYHAGEAGVRGGLELSGAVLLATVGALVVLAPGESQPFELGIFSRQQMIWAWGAQMLIYHYLPLALVCFFAWSAGESLCREGWAGKLTAFDALRRGSLRNATVARSALRGTAAGLILSAATFLAVGFLPGTWAPMTSLFEGTDGAWGFAIFTLAVLAALSKELFARLFLLPVATRRFGPWLGGGAVALLAAVLLFSPFAIQPFAVRVVFWLVVEAALVWLFLRYDLLTTLLASLWLFLLPTALPWLAADDPTLELQGALPLLAAALPLLLSLRWLASDKELVYHWDEVPPHVKRIAERERQRVELETARGIQSSILPELPSSLAGVEIAQYFRPATEVGGDFYDALALEDGRLAVAVGDVAGHGVSSGLIMSMAKSALAVQVTYDPAVDAVFRTLNRMVYQSARKRLLATLCYAVIDPARRSVVYASAGHLFPYRISPDGRLEALESVAYPLGARPQLEIRARNLELSPGDTLFLFSDGIVEARPRGSEEPFGFERLERSLARHAAASVTGLRDGVLADLVQFTGGAPRDDDQTLLVLRVA